MEQSADIRWQQRLVSFGKALKLLQEAMLNGPGALNQLFFLFGPRSTSKSKPSNHLSNQAF